MLNVTERAAAALHEALLVSGEADSDLLRLDRNENGLNLAVSSERDDSDQIVEYDSRAVLAIERAVAEDLDGSTLDTEDTEDGRRLVVLTPQDG
jgi:hypothetical protein